MKGFYLKYLVFILILLATSFFKCYGQNRIIFGKVIDSKTNLALPDIKVKIQGISTASVTNSKGNYEIRVPENLTNIKFENFSGKRISKQEEISGDEINLYLSDFTPNEIYELSLEELMNIKVDVASKVEEPLNDAPGIISVVTAKEIEDFGATSLRDILERVTGIVGLTEFSNRNIINMRGDQLNTSSKHVLILINGRPTRERIASGEDMEVYAMFPINTIERIEVIRGPGSVLYGTNAFTGVVNIITKQGKEYFSASISGATPTASLISVDGSSKLGQGMLSAGLYYKNLQDWEQSFTTELGIDTSYNTSEKGLGANISYAIGGFNVNTNLIVLNSFLVAPKFGGNYGDYIRHFIDVGYAHQFSEKIRTTTNVTNTHYHFEGFPLHPERISNDFLTEVTAYFNPNEQLNIVSGGIINHISGIANREINNEVVVTLPRYNQIQYTFYSQADFQLFNSFKVTGGFQLNKHAENVAVKFCPRLGLIWNPIKKLYVKALYAEAYRSPSAAEKTVNDTRRIGNPLLKPESVRSFDIEFRYLQKKTQASLTIFTYKQFDNVSFSQTDTMQFINQGEFSAQGVEFEVKYVPSSKLYFIGSSSYQTNLLNDSIENTTTGALTAKLGLSYTFDFGLSLGVFNIYNSAPPDVVWANPNRALVNPIPEAFNLLSANVNYNLSRILKTNRLELILNVRAENLLNEEIYNPEWVRTNINSIPGKPGRRIYFGIKLKY